MDKIIYQYLQEVSVQLQFLLLTKKLLPLTLNTNVINLYITIHFIYLIRILLLKKKFSKKIQNWKKNYKEKTFCIIELLLVQGQKTSYV